MRNSEEQQPKKNFYYRLMRGMLLGSIALPVAAGFYASTQANEAQASTASDRHEAALVTGAGGHVSDVLIRQIADDRSKENASRQVELDMTLLMGAEVVGAYLLARSQFVKQRA